MVFDNEGRRAPQICIILVAADAGRFYEHVWSEVTPMLQSKQRARAFQSFKDVYLSFVHCQSVLQRLSSHVFTLPA